MIGFPHRADGMGNYPALVFPPRRSGKSLQHAGAKICAAEEAAEKNRNPKKERDRFNPHDGTASPSAM